MIYRITLGLILGASSVSAVKQLYFEGQFSSGDYATDQSFKLTLELQPDSPQSSGSSPFFEADFGIGVGHTLWGDDLGQLNAFSGALFEFEDGSLILLEGPELEDQPHTTLNQTYVESFAGYLGSAWAYFNITGSVNGDASGDGHLSMDLDINNDDFSLDALASDFGSYLGAPRSLVLNPPTYKSNSVSLDFETFQFVGALSSISVIDASSIFTKLPDVDLWYSSASEIQPVGWRYFDWFKGFKPEGPNWIYHGRHGWLYVLADDTSSMFLWDVALGRWMFTNEAIYPWMYAYGPAGGWVFFFEGGSPGSRYFKRGDNGQVVSEQQLGVNP